MVFCTVTAFGKRRTAQLPVMDYYNRAIANPDAYQVNTAMQRCLAKAISLHGIGLYIYAGEDLPALNAKTQKEPIKINPSKTKITPIAGAMDAFTKEGKELLHVIAENLTHLTETDQLTEATHIMESLSHDEKVAVWSFLESKIRATLKRMSAP